MGWLPFLPRFVPEIKAGRKTRTARSKAYGMPGDTVGSSAGPLDLLSVERVPLRVVRDDYWHEEGVAGPAEFEAVWRQIHPRAGFDPDRLVYLHHFRLAEPERGA